MSQPQNPEYEAILQALDGNITDPAVLARVQAALGAAPTTQNQGISVEPPMEEEASPSEAGAPQTRSARPVQQPSRPVRVGVVPQGQGAQAPQTARPARPAAQGVPLSQAIQTAVQNNPALVFNILDLTFGLLGQILNNEELWPEVHLQIDFTTGPVTVSAYDDPGVDDAGNSLGDPEAIGQYAVAPNEVGEGLRTVVREALEHQQQLLAAARQTKAPQRGPTNW